MHFFSLLRVQFIIFTVIAISILLTCPAVGTDSKTGTPAPAQGSSASPACGQTLDSIMPLKKEFNTVSDWHAVAYLGESELANKCKETPSRLCFRKGKEGKDEDCFLARICCLSTGIPYECWSINELKVIPFFKKKHPEKVLLFSTQFNAAGSDWLDLITMWSYDKKTDKFIEITPKYKSKEVITFNSQGGYRLLDMNINGPKKILVFTDFIWGTDETHLARHYYRLYTYVFHPKKGFVFLGKYKTKKKYPGEDTATRPCDEIVIDGEANNIKRFVRQKLR